MSHLRVSSFFLPAITLFCFFWVGACKFFDPPEKIPAYLKVQNPRVLLDSVNQIYSPLGIKDAWIYQGGNPIGTFPVPATIPYTDLKKTDFFIDGGVFESGLSSFRLTYPFWERYQFNIVPEALDTAVIEPVFKYLGPDLIDFAMSEDFEQNTIRFTSIALSDETFLVKETDTVFSGDYAGRVDFDATNFVFDAVSEEFPFIARNVDTWAEITFKSDFPLTIGLFYLDPAQIRITDVTLYPTEGEWTTVYVHLVQLIRNNMVFPDTKFRLWLFSHSGGETGSLYLDNLRVVYFR